MKKVTYGEEAMGKMLKGLNLAADIVGSTLGPKGRNVFMEDPMGATITNDGVSVAARIILSDPEEDAGAYVVRNVTAATNDSVGDATTTTAVLVQSIVEESFKRPESVMDLEKSLMQAGNKILKAIAKQSQEVKIDGIKEVALISSEDTELATIISDMFLKLGKEAVINIEDSKTFETTYEIVDGYESNFGYMAPYAPLGKLTYIDVPVLVCEDKIPNPYVLNAVFEELGKKGIRTCIVACNDIEDATLGVLGISKIKGLFDSVVIRMNNEGLKDIAGSTGAKAVSASNGVNFQNLTVDDLGKARKIVCDANKTLILGDSISSNLYAARLEVLAENEPNMYIQKAIRDRIAKLKGSVGVLRIAAATDQTRGYKKDKAEDAIKTCLAALESGVCEGGGMTLWRIARDMKAKTPGELILKKSLTAPLRKIIENAGKDYAEVVMNMPEGKGYDARQDKYVTMREAGIVDAVKVELWALKNSLEAAAKFITTGALITDIPTKDAN